MEDIASVLEYDTAQGNFPGNVPDSVAQARETDAGALPPAPFNFLQRDDSFVQPRLWRFGAGPPLPLLTSALRLGRTSVPNPLCSRTGELG